MQHHWYNKLLICFFIGLLPIMTVAQQKNAPALLAHFSYGYQLPQGDLSERFNGNGEIHVGVDLIQPSNFIFGVAGQFQFGQDVLTDVLAPLRTAEGFIIGNDRNIAEIQLRQRGFYANGLIGYLWDFDKSEARSGLRITLGVGFWQHKIRIQDDPQRVVPQLLDDYKKGYDRLTNGLGIDQFVGYQLMSANGRINFIVGVNFLEGFTQNRRNTNFDLQSGDDSQRLDILIGGRVTWTLPFYLNRSANEIVY